MGADPRAVVVGEEAVAGPETHRLGTRRPHPRGDQVEGLVPGDLAPRVLAPSRPDEGHGESPWIANDLSRRSASHAEKSPAVGIVRVAADLDDASAVDVDQHSAQRRVTAHRTHRPDGSRRAHRDAPDGMKGSAPPAPYAGRRKSWMAVSVTARASYSTSADRSSAIRAAVSATCAGSLR